MEEEEDDADEAMAMAEIFGMVDQWTEELVSKVPRWLEEGKLNALSDHMANIMAEEKEGDDSKSAMRGIAALMGMIGLARILELHRERTTPKLDG